jgi:hypothetical protein
MPCRGRLRALASTPRVVSPASVGPWLLQRSPRNPPARQIRRLPRKRPAANPPGRPRGSHRCGAECAVEDVEMAGGVKAHVKSERSPWRQLLDD